MASVPAPTSRFLPPVPALAFFIVHCKLNDDLNTLLLKMFFGHNAYHNDKKQIKVEIKQ